MKKIIAVLLSLALLLGCAAGLAEDAEKQIFGSIRVNGEFTLKGIVPEGYKIIPFELDDDLILSRFVPEDPAMPRMSLSIAFDEGYSDVERLNDMDDDALAELEKTFTETDPTANITYDETEAGTRILVSRTQNDYYDSLIYLAIYKGYFVEFTMTPGAGAAEQKLSDEDVEFCNTFLSELDFVEGIEVPELVIKGKSFDALINGFDAEAKTIDVVLLTPIVMTEWQAVGIDVGDTIAIGTEQVEIGTLEYDGDDAIINDQYYLRKNEDGLYNPYDFEYPLMEEVKEMTLKVSDSLVFVEGVDPEWGEMLEEDRILTAGDLFTALAAAQEGGIRFDSQNVRITFDENGEAVQVQRYYAPWQ